MYQKLLCISSMQVQFDPTAFCATQCAADLRGIYDQCGYTGTANQIVICKSTAYRSIHK